MAPPISQMYLKISMPQETYSVLQWIERGKVGTVLFPRFHHLKKTKGNPYKPLYGDKNTQYTCTWKE